MDAASLGGGPSSADHHARSRAAVRSLLEGLPDATVCCSRDGVIVLANELAARLFGRPRQELVGRPVHTLWPARMRERYARSMERCFAGARPIRVTERALGMRRDGSEFVGEMSWGVVELDGEPVLVAIGRDLTPHLDGEARLLRRSRQQEVVAELGARALRGADPGELARLAAAQAGEALAADAVEVRLPPPAPGAPPPVVASWGRGDGDALPGASVPIAADARVHGVLVARRAAGLGSDDRAFLQAVGNVLATAAARRDADERIRHQALHDDLTGLANRALCRDRLEQAAARAARTGTTAAVLAVDIDGFKTVNDRCGHAAGDAVLVALAGRLASAVRPADTVARMGGDEFLVVCEDVDERTALALAHRVAEAVRRPLEVDGRRHELSASVGVAVSSPERPAADAL
ncbi:MAG TPA: sensor domain-containing diguanylate cyclase, partial [Solirubrobacteraceae bacterium]|nr:sensor domain-containing diguanylate cyclase [Solirubrobacteraceae bacterium]